MRRFSTTGTLTAREKKKESKLHAAASRAGRRYKQTDYWPVPVAILGLAEGILGITF